MSGINANAAIDSRFQRLVLGNTFFLGRCPRLKMSRALGAKDISARRADPTILTNLAYRLDEFGKIFAVAGGVVKRIETRVTKCFGKRDAAR